MTTLYLDTFSGISGDMTLGLLVDLGIALDSLQAELDKLPVNGYRLEQRQEKRHGIGGTRVEVVCDGGQPSRTWSEIDAMIEASALPLPVKDTARRIFRCLGEAEAHVHRVGLDEVHFHEVGAVDAIVDIVGSAIGLHLLEIQEVICAPLPLSSGMTQGSHGSIPLPAPAALALLKGVPISGIDLQAETVTPTGAVLLVSLSQDFGPIPPMRLEKIGYGAGGRDLPIPNLVRLLVGQDESDRPVDFGTLVHLETNIDDMNPEFYQFVMERLFEAGALDVYLTPIQMKKNRPATLLQALARPEDASHLRQIIFEQTPTLGIRQQRIERYALHRRILEVATPYGGIRVKIAELGGDKTKLAPEYEDCRTAAQQHQVPLMDVYQAAQQAAHALQAESPHNHAHTR